MTKGLVTGFTVSGFDGEHLAIDHDRKRILVVQPMVGIGDMVWHKPWLDEMIARHDITLMAKPSSHAAAVLCDHEGLTILPLHRSVQGQRGAHDGVRGFFGWQG